MTTDEKIQMTDEIDAMKTLMESEWWTDEMENANHHDMYGSFSFLEELYNLRVKERDGDLDV